MWFTFTSRYKREVPCGRESEWEQKTGENGGAKDADKLKQQQKKQQSLW